MFEGISKSLEKVFDGIKGKKLLNESHIDTAMREIRIALLEADVSLLKEKIGEFVKTPIDRGIKNTISYYKEHMHEK